MALNLYLERQQGGDWTPLVQGYEECKCRKRTKGCPLCMDLGQVVAPFHRSREHPKDLIEILSAGKTTRLPDDLSKPLFALAPVTMKCGYRLLSEVFKIDWRVEWPVESLVYPDEWLIFGLTREPPEVRFRIPAAGHELVLESEMPRIVHGVGKIDPTTRYVTKVKWGRPIAKHWPEFTGPVLDKLRLQSDPDRVRVVFWLT